MSDDLDDIGFFEFDLDDIPTNPGIGPVVEEKPKKLVHKEPCTACGSKTAVVVFTTVRCDNPNCRFFTLDR